MSNIWKIAIALTLVLCLSVAFISCGDNEEDGEIYITDSAGETVLGEDGKPLTEGESETFLPLAEDEDGENYGKLITPSNKK